MDDITNNKVTELIDAFTDVLMDLDSEAVMYMQEKYPEWGLLDDPIPDGLQNVALAVMSELFQAINDAAPDGTIFCHGDVGFNFFPCGDNKEDGHASLANDATV